MLGLVLTTTVLATGTPAVAERSHPGLPDLGPNVTVFDPAMPVSEIQATADRIYNEQVNDEMSTTSSAIAWNGPVSRNRASIGLSPVAAELPRRAPAIPSQ